MKLCMRRAASGGQRGACGVRGAAVGGRRAAGGRWLAAAATMETAMHRRRRRAVMCSSSPLVVTAMLFDIQYSTLLFLCGEHCLKPSRYVPYKYTYVYVPYDGTFGMPDQGQTLDV